MVSIKNNLFLTKKNFFGIPLRKEKIASKKMQQPNVADPEWFIPDPYPTHTVLFKHKWKLFFKSTLNLIKKKHY